MSSQPDKTFSRKTDDDILDLYLAGEAGHDEEKWKLILGEVKSRGLVSRYKQTSVKMRGFETEATGPHRSSWIKAQYDAGRINEKALLLVDDLLGEGKPAWLALKEVFELRRWLPRTIILETMNYEIGKKVSQPRLEPRPIPGLAEMELEYPKIMTNPKPTPERPRGSAPTLLKIKRQSI